MGMRAVEAIRDILLEGTEQELHAALKRSYRYPGHASYIVVTREFLMGEHDFKIKELLLSYDDPVERRDFLAQTKSIKGIGYKQASHFLRNVGFRGYAILDKHVVLSLYEFGVIDDPRPPTSRKRYLEVEHRLRGFAARLGIDFDEMDLLLWSEKTGKILK